MKLSAAIILGVLASAIAAQAFDGSKMPLGIGSSTTLSE
jgi:hypothetical protein